MRINVVDPGYTGTDLNHHQGTQTVDEGAEIIVRMAQVGPDGPTGGYFGRHGTVPWLPSPGNRPAGNRPMAGQVRRRSVAHRVSWCRVDSCSLCSTEETWLSTVLTEM